MKISASLLSPHVKRLDEQFRDLSLRLSQIQSPVEFDNLKTFIDHSLDEVHDLNQTILSLEQVLSDLVPGHVYEAFKRLKMNLHLGERKLRRQISNEHRVRKIQQRRAYVSTFAA